MAGIASNNNMEIGENVLDERFYTDTDSGEKISLRNASPIGVNSHFTDNSLSIYDKSTNKHHRITEAYDTQDEALERVEDFNKQMHDEMFTSSVPQSSHREQKKWEMRKREMAKEFKGY